MLRKSILLNLGAKNLNLGLVAMETENDMRAGAGNFADIQVVLEVGLFAEDIADKVSVSEITDKLTFKERGFEDNAPAGFHSVNLVAYMLGPEQADIDRCFEVEWEYFAKELLLQVLLLDASCPSGPAVIAPVAVVAGRQVFEL